MTTFERWRAIAEVIGFFTLIGSVIFVGLELQQNREIALSQAYQARAESSLEIVLSISENEVLIGAFSKIDADKGDELSPEEIRTLRFMFLARLIHWENVHYQYQQGFVSEEHWQTQVFDIKNAISYSSFSEIYLSNKGSWRESYRRFLDGLLEEIEDK